MKKWILFTFAITLFFSAKAQDVPAGFKTWLSLGTDVQATKKLSVGISQLFCFNTDPAELQFSQLSLEADYKLHKNTYLLAGVEQFHFKSGSDYTLYHKLSTGLMFRKLLGLPIKNALELEWFLPSQKKHRLRAVYTIGYSMKNSFLPWHGRPFVKGQLYYYYGGAPLTYYDATGETLAHQSPNDLHRYRLTGGLSFRPAKHWNIAMYYLWNKEFNSGLFENRDLNITSKNGSKIKYPFNDYSVLGLSFTYQLKVN